MNRPRLSLLHVLWTTLLLLGLLPMPSAFAQNNHLADCAEFAYSTEVDFVSQGPPPDDGNPIISDGDLLSKSGAVCMRNRDLLVAWEPYADLGLDAVDVVDVEQRLIAFSTELHDPKGRFRAGDLLATNGVVIPNAVLLRPFQVSYDIGLDGLHFVGEIENIVRFLTVAKDVDRGAWFESFNLQEQLAKYDIDIWFSTEGTERVAATTQILDGDLLSARHGITVLRQDMILPATVPAGIVDRGVDFGLDAVTSTRTPSRPSVRFSTELLFNGRQSFTDGDVLRAATGNVEVSHPDLIVALEPHARFLGLDALHIKLNEIDAEDKSGQQTEDEGTDSNPDTSGQDETIADEVDPNAEPTSDTSEDAQDPLDPSAGAELGQNDDQQTYLPAISSGNNQTIVAGP